MIAEKLIGRWVMTVCDTYDKKGCFLPAGTTGRIANPSAWEDHVTIVLNNVDTLIADLDTHDVSINALVLLDKNPFESQPLFEYIDALKEHRFTVHTDEYR